MILTKIFVYTPMVMMMMVVVVILTPHYVLSEWPENQPPIRYVKTNNPTPVTSDECVLNFRQRFLEDARLRVCVHGSNYYIKNDFFDYEWDDFNLTYTSTYGTAKKIIDHISPYLLGNSLVFEENQVYTYENCFATIDFVKQRPPVEESYNGVKMDTVGRRLIVFSEPSSTNITYYMYNIMLAREIGRFLCLDNSFDRDPSIMNAFIDNSKRRSSIIYNRDIYTLQSIILQLEPFETWPHLRPSKWRSWDIIPLTYNSYCLERLSKIYKANKDDTLNICIQIKMKNAKFLGPNNAIIEPHEAVEFVVGEMNSYVLGPIKKLKAVVDSGPCFMNITFVETQQRGGVIGFTYWNTNNITVKIDRTELNVRRYYKTIAHEIGHVFCLTDDHSGYRSIMDYKSYHTLNYLFKERDLYAYQKIIYPKIALPTVVRATTTATTISTTTTESLTNFLLKTLLATSSEAKTRITEPIVMVIIIVFHFII